MYCSIERSVSMDRLQVEEHISNRFQADVGRTKRGNINEAITAALQINK